MNDPTATGAVAPGNRLASRGRLQMLVLLAVTALCIYLCYILASPFLSSIGWALALAVVFTPFQRWIESKVGSPNLAALISVTVIGVVVLGLMVFVGERLIREAINGAEVVNERIESGEWRRAMEVHPRLTPLAVWMERQNLLGTVRTVATWMTTTGSTFVRGSVIQVLELLMTFYLLFFFLRDRHVALRSLQSLSPLTTVEMDGLCDRVSDTILATVNGILAVSTAQGVLGGLMFQWLGLPAPLLWGLVMALLSVVPVLGAFIVWVPAALFLAIDGSWGKALILSLWGGLVVGTVDNVMRPYLVGKKLKLHTVLAFMSVVGGLFLFGPAGLILGPVLLTVTTELLEIWKVRTSLATPVFVDPDDLSRFENEGGGGQ